MDTGSPPSSCTSCSTCWCAPVSITIFRFYPRRQRRGGRYVFLGVVCAEPPSVVVVKAERIPAPREVEAKLRALFVLTASFCSIHLTFAHSLRKFILQISRFLQFKYWITIFYGSAITRWIIYCRNNDNNVKRNRD